MSATTEADVCPSEENDSTELEGLEANSLCFADNYF